MKDSLPHFRYKLKLHVPLMLAVVGCSILVISFWSFSPEVTHENYVSYITFLLEKGSAFIWIWENYLNSWHTVIAHNVSHLLKYYYTRE